MPGVTRVFAKEFVLDFYYLAYRPGPGIYQKQMLNITKFSALLVYFPNYK